MAKELMAEIHEDENGFIRRSDMTLRDWFAGQVLAGKMGIDSIEYLSPDDIAQRCYRQADAMLEARK